MADSVNKPKVLIVATHPIQYQVPWYRYLDAHLTDYQFEVLYLTLPDDEKQGVGFGLPFQWDIPMLEGYLWTQVKAEYTNGDMALDSFFSIRLKRVGRLIKTLRPDAVLLTGWQSMGLLQLLVFCRQLKIPCLIRSESNDLKPRGPFKTILHRILLQLYDRYLAIGQANLEFYLSRGVRTENIFTCPYFVDNNYFKDRSCLDASERRHWRQELQIPDNAFCFCFVGKLNTKKRIIDVLDALGKVGDKTVYLIIVGDGELMEAAKSFTRTHGLNAVFAGFLNQSQLPTAYASSHCLILASDYEETWGLVVNEAMASGIPAIVSRRSGCYPDLIREGVTGYSFEFGNTDDLAQKMRLIKALTPNEYKAICKNARRHVIENYSVRNASQGLHSALKTVIKQVRG